MAEEEKIQTPQKITVVQAKFQSEHQILDYKNGHIYNLQIKDNTISRLDGESAITYPNIETLLSSWGNIQRLD